MRLLSFHWFLEVELPSWEAVRDRRALLSTTNPLMTHNLFPDPEDGSLTTDKLNVHLVTV